MNPNLLDRAIEEPLFEPAYVNPDYFYGSIYSFIKNIDIGPIGGALRFVSYVLTLFAITIILYSIVRIIEIHKENRERMKEDIRQALARKKEREENGGNPVWRHIESLINSPNPGDWRLAIIEADTVLEKVLRDRGFEGATIGERLKNIGPGDIINLQKAWDAHSLRNRIAHEGSAYDLSEREARSAISSFEAVFRELGFL